MTKETLQSMEGNPLAEEFGELEKQLHRNLRGIADIVLFSLIGIFILGIWFGTISGFMAGILFVVVLAAFVEWIETRRIKNRMTFISTNFFERGFMISSSADGTVSIWEISGRNTTLS